MQGHPVILDTAAPGWPDVDTIGGQEAAVREQYSGAYDPELLNRFGVWWQRNRERFIASFERNSRRWSRNASLLDVARAAYLSGALDERSTVAETDTRRVESD